MKTRTVRLSLQLPETFTLACVQFNVDPHDFLQFLVDNITLADAIVKEADIKSLLVQNTFQASYGAVLQQHPDTAETDFPPHLANAFKKVKEEGAGTLENYVCMLYHWSDHLHQQKKLTAMNITMEFRRIAISGTPPPSAQKELTKAIQYLIDHIDVNNYMKMKDSNVRRASQLFMYYSALYEDNLRERRLRNWRRPRK